MYFLENHVSQTPGSIGRSTTKMLAEPIQVTLTYKRQKVQVEPSFAKKTCNRDRIEKPIVAR